MFLFGKPAQFFVLLGFAYIFFPLPSFAFGISPSSIDLGEVYRGETVEREVNITTHKDEVDIIAGFKITASDTTGLVLYTEEIKREDRESGFVVLPLKIQTEKAVQGMNKTVLTVTPLYVDREQMVDMSLSLPLEIQFAVSDTKKEQAFIQHVSISQEKTGESIRFFIRNEGNSTLNIRKPQIAFLDKTIVLDIEGTIPVGMSKTFTATIDTTDMDFGRHAAILRFPQNTHIEEYGFSYHKYTPSYLFLYKKNLYIHSLLVGLLALVVGALGITLVTDKKTL